MLGGGGFLKDGDCCLKGEPATRRKMAYFFLSEASHEGRGDRGLGEM